MLCRYLFLAGCLSIPACNVQRFFLGKAVEGQAKYFHHTSSADEQLAEVAPGVWTYQLRWERALIVVTDAGLVVTDPFNPAFAGALRRALARRGLWQPVHTVVYSHHHLDHVGGAAVLEPGQVVAHADCQRHWDASSPRDLMPPTRTIKDHTRLTVGGVAIDLVPIPHAHAQTHVAVHIEDSVLYAPDTVAPGVMLLGGLPAVPLDGFFADMERLAALDFEIFVASHFGYGSKDDFVKTTAMLEDLRDIARETLAGSYAEGGIHFDVAETGDAFRRFYDAAHERCGKWHGFDAQILGAFLRVYTAELLGDTPWSSASCDHDSLAKVSPP